MTRSLRLLATTVAIGVLGLIPIVPVDASAAAPARHVRAHAHEHPPHARGPRHRPELYGVTPRMMAEAERVSKCEEGGDWAFVGQVFDGGIGWTIANWQQFRRPGWPARMHAAPPRMQANALFRFVHHYGIAMPDQDGSCDGY